MTVVQYNITVCLLVSRHLGRMYIVLTCTRARISISVVSSQFVVYALQNVSFSVICACVCTYYTMVYTLNLTTLHYSTPNALPLAIILCVCVSH